MQKSIVFGLLFLLVGFTAQSQTSFYDKADAFFKTYTKDGSVNYTALKADKTLLNGLVKDIASTENKTNKAYLINAYNILVINQMVKNGKTAPPTSINGFFENKTSVVAGKKVSLNEIENEMIRKVYKDARVHFVLVCGAKGCPVIADYAYTPTKVEQQLNTQTTKAMNSNFVYQKDAEKTVYLSKIFEWYKEDFGKTNKDAVAFVNKYRKNKLNTSYKIKHYEYDWTPNAGSFTVKKKLTSDASSIDQKSDIEISFSTDDDIEDEINLQTFTAGGLLGKGMFDFTLFNTMYTETKNNWMGTDFTGYRTTFVTHLLQVTYGITESKRINVGLDVNFRSSGTAVQDSSFSAVGRAFDYRNDDTTRVGITSVGARIKVQPFKSLKDFSIQSTLSAPTIKVPEGDANLFWADWNRIQWWNQIFYSKTFGDFQLFTELDFLFRFPVGNTQIGMLDMPASVFLSYFPTKKITVYVMTQHMQRFARDVPANDPVITDFVVPANYTSSGVGFKYQFQSNFNIELLYTNFWRGQNNGLGSTFNVGLKYLTK